MTTALTGTAASACAFGDFLLVPERQVLLKHGHPVSLGGRAWALLQALVDRAGDTVSKRELLAIVWPSGAVAEGNLKMQIAALRRALGDEPACTQYIATVTGRGYRFVAIVRKVAPTPSVSSPVAVPRAAAARGHNLPAERANVLGRSADIHAIAQALARSRLVSIVGAGGTGKTAVARRVAAQAVPSFHDGVWWVDLASIANPEDIPTVIANAAGVAMPRTEGSASWSEAFRERERLLVLDNCEHLAVDVARCAAHLLAQAPRLKLLTTSRMPLRVAGEHVHRLVGLETPPPLASLSARQALAFPAIELFVESAKSSCERYELWDTDVAPVAELCRRLDGVPLAIELATTRLHAFGVKGLLAQLNRCGHLLTGRRAGPVRHRSLAASFDWSYELLSKREASTLRALSVFDGTFDLADASTVSGLGWPEVAETLALLASKSLVDPGPQGTANSFVLSATTRHHSRARLQFSAEADAVRTRHAQHQLDSRSRAQCWPEFENPPATWRSLPAACVVSSSDRRVRPHTSSALRRIGPCRTGQVHENAVVIAE